MILKVVERCVSSLGGIINEVITNNSQTIIICVWGCSLFEHEDDAARAVLCGLCLRKELGTLKFCFKCNMGISTDIGFTGNIEYRHIIIGNIINTVMSIINWSKSCEKAIGEIYVDKRTMQNAASKIKFKHKIKLEGLFVYEPIDPDKEFLDEYKGENMLVHANNILYDNKGQVLYKGIRDEVRRMANEDFKNFLASYEKPTVAVICGSAGNGKTFFAKTLAHDLGRNKSLQIFTSRLNPLSEKRFLNNWRSVLVSVTQYMAVKEGIDRERFIEQVLKEFNINDKLDLIEDILSIKLPSKSALGSHYQLPGFFNNSINEEAMQALFPFIIDLFQRLTNYCITVVFLDDCTQMDKV